MKRNKLTFGLLASGMALAVLTQSCVSDEPFAATEGEGSLRMKLVINSDLTRAVVTDDAALRDSCVVYISKAQGGLVQKYKGISNIPAEILLKSGNYIVEAWTGDSVPASFEDRFYRGYQTFTITNDNNTAVALTCKIANVAVSVNPDASAMQEMGDWKLTVSNSSGSLVFNEDNVLEKGYFMMPNADFAKNASGEILRDENDWALYTNLKYKIEGTNSAGEAFSQEGLIGSSLHEGKIVEHAHEYRLNLSYNPDHETQGGALITVVIDDTPIESVSYDFGIYSAPSIKGVDFNIDSQYPSSQKPFGDIVVKVSGFNGLKSLVLSQKDGSEAFGLPAAGTDLLAHASDIEKREITELGITWDNPTSDDRDITITHITFGADFFNKLEERPTEYALTITATDGYGKTTSKELRIAVGSSAVVIDDPIVIDSPADNLLSVRAHSATLTGMILNSDMNPVIEYRKKNTFDWTPVSVLGGQTRASDYFSVKITGLEENTTYEYRVAADDYQSETVKTFTTESTYTIPNGDMEQWSNITKSGKTWALPGPGSTKTFWDNGNEGASTISSTNVCEGSTDKKHGGMYSAKLSSKKILGLALAAGNLFTGEYLERSGMGAKLNFGREYQGGSHPEGLNVWVHYTPANVSDAKSNLKSGEKDHGQIFIAFATQAAPINTSSNVFFDPNADYILGYGEKTWAGVGCGNGDDLEEVYIPITWYDRAKTMKPTHIIIVCSSSKFGDYLEGGNGSVMYVDDFELVY